MLSFIGCNNFKKFKSEKEDIINRSFTRQKKLLWSFHFTIAQVISFQRYPKRNGRPVLSNVSLERLFEALFHKVEFFRKSSIDCNVTHTSPEGGGLGLWLNNGLLGLSCCFFSSCHSEDDAGAIRYDFRVYQRRSYPFRFCFFYKNTAQLGNDFLTNGISDDASPALHCFTTATENSFYNTDSYQDSWLPQGSISLVYLSTSGGNGYIDSPMYNDEVFKLSDYCCG